MSGVVVTEDATVTAMSFLSQPNEDEDEHSCQDEGVGWSSPQHSTLQLKGTLEEGKADAAFTPESVLNQVQQRSEVQQPRRPN